MRKKLHFQKLELLVLRLFFFPPDRAVHGRPVRACHGSVSEQRGRDVHAGTLSQKYPLQCLSIVTVLGL